MVTFETYFLAFLTDVHKNKWHFLWDKTGQHRHAFARKFWIWKFDFIWSSLTWHWPSLAQNLEINVTIEIYVPNDARNICDTALMQHFDLVTLFDLALTLALLSIRFILICYLVHPLEMSHNEVWVAAFVSSASVADKAKSDNFHLWPDLDLTSHLLIFFSTKKILIECFWLAPRPPRYGHPFAI